MGRDTAWERPAHVVWVEGGGCDGCTMAMLGASEPALEDLCLGRVPQAPRIELTHPALALDAGESYLARLRKGASGELAPMILVLEGSVLDETMAGQGYFSRLGEEDGRPLSTADWIDDLAPRADAVIAIGSCATWGGVPAAAGSPTGAKGLEEYLGRDFASRSGLPVVNLPGCAPSGDAFLDALVYVLHHVERRVPLDLDEERRPRWLYREPAHPVPARADYVPIERYATEGKPAVGCPVPTMGWMGGLGGCARVGGDCIGCTDRDFTDRWLPHSRVHGTG